MIQTQPSSTATAGTPFGAQPVVYEEDQYGNLETGDSTTVVTASLHTGSGSLQGVTSVTVSGGVARFTNLSDSQAETVSLDFTGGGLTAGPSSAIAVSRPKRRSVTAPHRGDCSGTDDPARAGHDGAKDQ